MEEKNQHIKSFDCQIWQYKIINTGISRNFKDMKTLVVFQKLIYVLSKGFDRKFYVYIQNEWNVEGIIIHSGF